MADGDYERRDARIREIERMRKTLAQLRKREDKENSEKEVKRD